MRAEKFDKYYYGTLYYAEDTGNMKLGGVWLDTPRVLNSTKVMTILPTEEKERYSDLVCGMRIISKDVRTTGSKLFITPESRISRDIVRRDFKIVRSVDNADYVVVPSLQYEVQTYNCLISFKLEDKNCLFVCRFHRGTYNSAKSITDGLTEEQSQKALDKIKEGLIAELGATDFEVIAYSFRFNYSKEYLLVEFNETVMNTVNAFFKNQPYVPLTEDYSLPLSPSNTISLDQLLLWTNNNQTSIVYRQLADSDWKEYPLTVCLLLRHIGRYAHPSSLPTCCIPMMRNIRYYEVFSSNCIPEDYKVTDKDWKMAQDFQLALLNVNGKYGFLESTGVLYKLPFEGKYLKRCIMVGRYEFDGGSQAMSELSKHLGIN